MVETKIERNHYYSFSKTGKKSSAQIQRPFYH